MVAFGSKSAAASVVVAAADVLAADVLAADVVSELAGAEVSADAPDVAAVVAAPSAPSSSSSPQLATTMAVANPRARSGRPHGRPERNDLPTDICSSPQTKPPPDRGRWSLIAHYSRGVRMSISQADHGARRP